MLRNITNRDCLQRITGVKYENFQKFVSRLNRSWRAVQRRKLVAGVARTFAVAADLLSNVHDAFVFGTNFQGGRDDDLPSDTAHRAACRADFENKTGKIIERK